MYVFPTCIAKVFARPLGLMKSLCLMKSASSTPSSSEYLCLLHASWLAKVLTFDPGADGGGLSVFQTIELRGIHCTHNKNTSSLHFAPRVPIPTMPLPRTSGTHQGLT